MNIMIGIIGFLWGVEYQRKRIRQAPRVAFLFIATPGALSFVYFFPLSALITLSCSARGERGGSGKKKVDETPSFCFRVFPPWDPVLFLLPPTQEPPHSPAGFVPPAFIFLVRWGQGNFSLYTGRWHSNFRRPPPHRTQAENINIG